MLAQIRSGVDLDQLTFGEGNITYQNLWNINRNTNPHLYTELSDAVNNNYKQPFHEESENEDEEESHPLPIPGTSLTLVSQQFSNEQSFESMNYELEKHLGKHLETEIEKVFWERTTPELE